MTTTDTTPSSDVATRPTGGPSDMVQAYEGDFAQVLPSHVNSKTWVRLAIGALRRDKNLNQAAKNDPGALMVALLDAARKGLEPGTEQYYLVPRKEKGVVKVKGIEGYQGIIERIYRAGAASSVIVEVVREHDTFRYVPGRDERPVHEIDWFGADRGKLVGVYAYAIMVGGATSKVVVLNEAKVMEAKAKSDGASSQYSPWNQGDGEAMWLKTAARRLEKWVPTSSEYMKERLRVAQEVIAERPVRTVGDSIPQPITTDDGTIVDPEIGVVDAELMDPDEPTWPPTPEPGGGE